MSEAPPSQPENGTGAPDPDRVRPLSARPGPGANAAPPGQGPAPKAQNGRNGGPARAQQPQQPTRERQTPPTESEAPAAPSPGENPGVRFSDNGVEWVARALGQGTSGWGSGGSAPLVLLTFARAERPDDPVREILSVGRGADRFSETELVALLGRAKPFDRVPRKQPIFSGTRGKKGDL